MTHPKQPSDLYAALTWERLVAIRRVLVETRAWVVEHAEPDRGDDATIIGYRAWKHGCHRISQLAAKEYAGWLSVKEPVPVFIFKICMMPVRFCRAESEDAIPPQYRSRTDGEQRDIMEAVGGSFDGFLRIIVQADHTGAPQGVHLVHVDAFGEPIMSWEIPQALGEDGALPVVDPINPITLGPLDAVVKTKDQIAAQERSVALGEHGALSIVEPAAPITLVPLDEVVKTKDEIAAEEAAREKGA